MATRCSTGITDTSSIDLEKGLVTVIETAGPETNATKHASIDLAGSVYLIAADGRILKLPIPSTSYRDPLNWSLARRACVMGVMMLFAAVFMLAVQMPGMMTQALRRNYTENVSELLAQTLQAELMS
jgi:hypothetical protein